MFKKLTIIAGCLLLAACGQSAMVGKPITSGNAGNGLTVTLASADGVLRDGKNEFTITFSDSSGKPVDVGAAAVNFHMPAMGTMPVMNDAATLTTSGTPGVYRGLVKLQMAGDWQTQIIYEGAAGKGRAMLPIVAQ
ncbi:MAG: FixH family protein [Acidobacteria bacterium]|nr:FixH family protein [Acidobacteriota bacterium]